LRTPLLLVELRSASRRPPPRSTLFPYTTLFRSLRAERASAYRRHLKRGEHPRLDARAGESDRVARTAERRRAPHVCSDGAEAVRSEEHTSELQSLRQLVCRLLLEKKKGRTQQHN